MEKLQALPNVSRLSNCVTRILGQNPGKFTLQGTNTYLVGTRPPFVLIDTGEGRETYPALLEEAITAQSSLNGRQSYSAHVSDIIITHQHYDHFGGLPDVLKLLRRLHDAHASAVAYNPPRIHKYPSSLPPSAAEGAHTVDHASQYQSVLSSLQQASCAASPSGDAVHALTDGQRIETQDGSATLEIIHTPGHTTDSICLALRPQTAQDRNEEKQSEKPVLFTADTVLGQGTAVFEDLSSYISSLKKLLTRRSDRGTDGDFGHIYPGHGPVIEDGPAAVATYIKHRLEREEQIVSVLSGTSPAAITDRSWTVWEIVSVIYKAYPQSLWLPAAHSVGLHLAKLEKDGRARCLGGDGVDQRWALIAAEKE